MSEQQNANTIPSVEDFGKETTISAVDDQGRPVRYVLLTDNSIAKVREGKGKDVEKATMISNGDQSKYLSAMMAATIQINDTPMIMEDLGELGMKDYMRLQLAFADINF